jgi:hypothetical protein
MFRTSKNRHERWRLDEHLCQKIHKLLGRRRHRILHVEGSDIKDGGQASVARYNIQQRIEGLAAHLHVLMAATLSSVKPTDTSGTFNEAS